MTWPWYFEATLTVDGERIACWTSHTPGRTGPRQPWWRWPLMTRQGWHVRLRRRP